MFDDLPHPQQTSSASAPVPPPPSAGGKPIPTKEPEDMLAGVVEAPQPPRPLTTPPLADDNASANTPTILPQELLADRSFPWRGVITIAALVIIIGGATSAYVWRDKLFFSPKVNEAATTPTEEDNNTATIPTPAVSTPVIPIDTDGDGLTDDVELAGSTDSQNPDTDGDGLFDGEELNTYHTDPLKSDTDNDSYMDGDEVRNGFDPNGSGKLFEVPTQ